MIVLLRALTAIGIYATLMVMIGDEVRSLAAGRLVFGTLDDLLGRAGIDLPYFSALPGSLAAIPAVLAAALTTLLTMTIALRTDRRAARTVIAETAGVAVLVATGNSANLPVPVPPPAMPARIPAPAPRKSPKTQPASPDREFLPAALEILQTPPSPIATSLLLCICAAFSVALAWSYFGHLDIHAVATGKVQPSGRSKIVQPLEAGKVVLVHVENGSMVRAGDLLVELDPTETGADRESLARDVEALNAEIARRKVSVAVAAGPELKPRPIVFAANTSDNVKRREEGVAATEIAQLASSQASLKAQVAEKQATRQKLLLGIEARKNLIALSQERVSMRQTLSDQGAGSRALIIESEQQLQTHLVADAQDFGQLFETDAALVSLERKIEEVVSQFVSDQTQKLAEAERKRDRQEQELIKAQSKTDRTRLRSPIDGIVQQLNLTTVGQVVTSGQSLLTIVPVDGPVEVEAMIANKDIGFVDPGQTAMVKIEAFPFTRYGTITGTVAKVSREAVDEQDANAAGGGSAGMRQSAGGAPRGAGRGQNLVFPATIQLSRRTINVGDKDVALTPGMAVTVEIKTGQRRVIDYLMSPLREIGGQTGHER